MRTFTAVIEKCADTGFYVGYVPGFPGAHSQAASVEELRQNLKEVIEMHCIYDPETRGGNPPDFRKVNDTRSRIAKKG